jgi:hemerythrin-like domain-containing protein
VATKGTYTTDTNDMRAVHAALLSSLDSAAGLVGGAGSDRAAVVTASSFLGNVVEFLHVHHRSEDDLIYRPLKERCPDDSKLLTRIEDQHRLLDQPMADARTTLEAWRSDPTTATAGPMVGAFSLVHETLAPHLAEEEDEVLPIASAHLSPEEWAQLPGHAMSIFTGDKPWLALGLVREGLTEEQRSEMLAGMPPPLQQLWIDEWEPAFNTFIAEVRAIPSS